MIASVAFRNFKALRATSLALRPINLVIGPNGSGKTSLIDALRRLRTLSRLGPAPHPEPESRGGGPELEFRFGPPHDGLVVRLGCISDTVCDVLRLEPENAPGWPALQTELGRIRSYSLDHEAMAQRVSRSAGTELSSNGGNLAAVLVTMREREPAAFAALRAELLRIMPEFRALELVEGDGNEVELVLDLEGNGSVPSGDVSQGTLYLLGMLTLAFDPTPPRVLCIEEIDRGMHPRMLREVRDTLYRLSYPQSFGSTRTPVQVVATTHSPYLLDLFRDHPEEIVMAHKRGRVARFERLADRPDLPELLQEGSLGDMWFSGILGGVPDEE